MDFAFLEFVGLSFLSPKDFSDRDITLRDGRSAKLWVHSDTGHGILDKEFWPSSENYYQEEYRTEASSESDGSKVCPSTHKAIYESLNKRQFEQFSNLLSPETKYLEIGCSFGGVLGLVAKSGIAQTHGVEPNFEDAAFTQEQHPNACVFNSSLEEAKLEENSYDIITCFEVLEHIANPLSFLQKASSLLKPGGRINLEVPNHRDVLLTCYQSTAYQQFYYHKAHIHYFTQLSIEKLFEMAGFEGKALSFLMYPFFNNVFWAQNNTPQGNAAAALEPLRPNEGQSEDEKAISDFFSKTEAEYETLVNKRMLGDCLVYQGRFI